MTELNHSAVEKVRKALAEHGVRPQIQWLDDAATTAQQAAEALGIDVGQIANSLIFSFEVDQDEAEPILVLTSGAHRVDTDWLGDQIGGRIGRASKGMVKEATGQVIGGVAPVGHPQQIRTFIDSALAQYTEVWAAAGHAKTIFPTHYDQLLQITRGRPTAVRPDAESPDRG